MRKVLIPKKDYVKELIKIIRVTKDEQKLRNLLSDYHEKDIAEAITFLTETERKHLYRVLGSERIAEIFSYFDDAEMYLEELSLEQAAKVVSYMDADSIPVLTQEKKIVGILTATDIVELVDDAMGDDYAKLAGLTSEEDLKEPTIVSMKKRLPWLIILLFLGMAVSSVVGIFESVVAVITYYGLAMVFLIDIFHI